MDTTKNKALKINKQKTQEHAAYLDIELLADRIQGLNPATYIDYHARLAGEEGARRWAFLRTFSTDLTKNT